jgi:hypothetical protein
LTAVAQWCSLCLTPLPSPAPPPDTAAIPDGDPDATPDGDPGGGPGEAPAGGPAPAAGDGWGVRPDGAPARPGREPALDPVRDQSLLALTAARARPGRHPARTLAMAAGGAVLLTTVLLLAMALLGHLL